eukprot:gene8925-9877_t
MNSEHQDRCNSLPSETKLRLKKKGKGRFFKSNSFDSDGFLKSKNSYLSEEIPEKPHPLRSPMRSFFKNNTVPRTIKSSSNGKQDCSKVDYRALSISPNAQDWTLEDDVPNGPASTVDGTPFSQTSNQLYYKTRPTVTVTELEREPSKHMVRSRSAQAPTNQVPFSGSLKTPGYLDDDNNEKLEILGSGWAGCDCDGGYAAKFSSEYEEQIEHLE